MKINRKIFLTIIVLFGLAISSSQLIKAETYCDTVGDLGSCYVDGSVTASGDGKTPSTAFKTIQEAADVVGPGDTVNVRGRDDSGEQIVYSDTTCSDGVLCINNSGTVGNLIVYQAWPEKGIPKLSNNEKPYGIKIDQENYIKINGFQIEQSSFSAIIVFGGGNNLITNNILTENAFLGIYNFHSPNNKIYNNIIYNSQTPLDGGFHADGNSSHTGIEVKNNIIINTVTGIAVGSDIPLIYDNNLLYKNESNYSINLTPASNDISSAPLFVDAANGNFKLQAHSPAIDAGATLVDVTDDIVGTARPFGDGYDIGAYENRHYYVDGSATGPGDDTNPGSRTAPWKTIQKGADTIVAGDTVNVRGRDDSGEQIVYSDTTCGSAVVCPANSGSENNYITYQAWPGEGIPTITSDTVNYGFDSYESYIIINSFLIKDVSRGIVNYEGSQNIIKNNTIENTSLGIYFNGGNANKIFNNTISDNFIGLAIDANGPTSVETIENNIITNSTMYGINIASSTIGHSANNNLFWNNATNYRDLFTNHSNDIFDQDPQFIDPDNGNYRLKFNSPARDAGVALPEVPRDIVGTNRPFGNGVDIGAFETRHFYVDGTDGNDSSNGQTPETAWKTIQHAADTMVAGDIVNVKGDMTYTTDDPEPNPFFSDTNSMVITKNSGTQDASIIYQAWPNMGIPTLDGRDSTSGIFVNEHEYIEISGFKIVNTLGSGSISYGICYFFTSSGMIKNNVLKNNILGIYSFHSSNIKVYNNTLDNNYYAGFHADGNSSNTGLDIKNNIATRNGSLGGLSLNSPISYSSNNNNCWDNDGYAGEYGQGYQKGENDISVDPKFINLEEENFKLRSNSPMIDSGSALSEVDTDILGITRPQGVAYDIGAFEYYDVSVSLTPLSPDPTNNNSPTLAGSSVTANGTISQVKYSLNNGDWLDANASDGSFNASSENFKIQLNSLADGEYSIRVKAIDSYGNETSPNDYANDTFIVDTTIPNPKLTQLGTLSVTLDNVNGAHWYYTGTKPKFIGTSEANSTTKFTIEEVDSKDINVSSEGSWDYENQLTTQTYEVSFFGRDAAGNVSGTQSFLLTIDPTAQSFPDYIKERLGVGMSGDEIDRETDEETEEELIIEQSNGDLYEAEEVPEDNTGDGTDSQPNEPEGDTGQIGGQSIFQQAGFWLLCVLPLAILLIVFILIYVKKKNNEDQ